MEALLASWGISTAKLQTMEILSFNRAELLVAVLAIAGVFGVLDVLLQLTARGTAARFLRPQGGTTVKPPSEGDITKTLLIVLSFLHLAIQLPVGLAVLLDPRLAADPVYGVSPLSQAMVTISTGYFTYDLLCVLARYELEGAAFLVHALCCLFVYGYAVFFGTLHWFGAAFLMWEASTPFVNIRWILSAQGRSSTRLYVANGLAMVAVFFVCRNLWGTWCSVLFFRATQAELDAPRPDGFSPAGIWGYRIANVSLNALNAVWFSKMATKAVALVKGGGGGGGKGGKKQR